MLRLDLLAHVPGYSLIIYNISLGHVRSGLFLSQIVGILGTGGAKTGMVVRLGRKSGWVGGCVCVFGCV